MYFCNLGKVHKAIKTWKKIIYIILAIVIGIPILASIIVQTPPVQNYIVRKVTESVNSRINGKLDVGRVYMVFISKLIVSDALLTTEKGDTAASIGHITVTVPPAFWVGREIKVGKVILNDGYFRYAKDSTGKSNFQSIFEGFSKKDSLANAKAKSNAKDSTVKKGCYSLKSLQLKNFQVLYDKWNADDIYLTFKDLRYCNDSISCKITEGMAKEKSGIEIKEMKAALSYTPTSIELSGLTLKDAYSDIEIDTASVRGDTTTYLNDFMHAARLNLKMADSHISSESAVPFVPSLKGKDIHAVLRCRAEGTYDNLQVKELNLRTPDGGTAINVDAFFSGLSDPKNALVHVGVSNCYTSVRQIANIINEAGDTKTARSIAKFAPGQNIRFQGSLDGFFDDFVAYGTLNTTSAGAVKLDMQMQKDARSGKINLNGHANTKEVDLGKILQSSSLGKLTLESSLNAALGKDQEHSSIDLKNLSIKRLGLMGYDYSNIVATGTLKGYEFDGKLACSDPNLNLLFQGIFTFAGKKGNSVYKFSANLGYADLNALNLYKKDKAEVRLSADANLTTMPSGDAYGAAKISGLHFVDKDKDRDIGEVTLTASNEGNSYRMNLNSKILKASYEGTAAVSQFGKDFSKLLARESGNLMDEPVEEDMKRIGQTYDIWLQTYDTRDVCSFFAPGLFVNDSTTLKLDINRDDIITGSVKSNLVSYQNNYVRNLWALFDNRGSKLTTAVSADLLINGSIPLNKNVITIITDDNVASGNIRFSASGPYNNKGNISAKVSFFNADEPYRIAVDMQDSYLDIQGEHWAIEPGKVLIKDKHFDVRNLNMHCSNQEISIDGLISASAEDTASIAVKNFDLSLLNTFLTDFPAKFSGTLSGHASAFSILSNPTALVDFNGRNIKIGKGVVGDIALSTQWMTSDKLFKVMISTTNEGRHPLNIGGTFKPTDKRLDLGVDLDRFDVACAEPFLASVFSGMGGSISGGVDVSGTFDKLKLNSRNLQADSVGLLVGWTNVAYILTGPIGIKDNKVTFQDMTLKDVLGKKGKVSGGIDLGNFSNLVFNTRIDFNDIMGVNNNAKISPQFYATAFATGSCRILGPLNKIVLDIRLRTDENTVLHIPLGGEGKQSHSLLTFINSSKVNETDFAFDSLMHASKPVKNTGSLEIKVDAMATPGALVMLELNTTSGDAAKVRGSGNVIVDIDTGKDLFDIKGLYTVSEGEYRLNVANIASKNLTIDEGGTFEMFGDIMQSELNLTAKYKTKAPIGVLIGDTTSVSTRRNINCGIAATGKLINPELKFSIDIPDLDPTTKGKVESALNTDDKVMKQFITLLVTGGFIPNEQSGIMDNTKMLYSNASEMLANSLNSVFRQLDIPIDLGFTYQPGYNQKDIFDVALSTTLFNNRVTVSGSVGNKQYSTGNGNLAGDIDVEIKLDKNGRIRLSLFSHSADQYTNYLDQTQRNGAGIVWQEEFDTFDELYRKVFWSKKRMQEYMQSHIPDGMAPPPEAEESEPESESKPK